MNRSSGSRWFLVVAVSLAFCSTARADSLLLTLGEAVSNRTSEIAATLETAPSGGTATHVAEPVRDTQTFLRAISSLRDGDVLYLNTHSNTNLVSLGDEDLTFDQIAAALRTDRHGNPRNPPRLLAVVIDGCMEGATRPDFEHVSQAFNSELVIGWQSWANSAYHQSCMYGILHHVFITGAPLAELPFNKVPAFCGRPYLYAPTNYYGWTIDEVYAHLLERLGRGANRDVGAEVYDSEFCAGVFAENPIYCTFPPMNDFEPGPEEEERRQRCCPPAQ